MATAIRAATGEDLGHELERKEARPMKNTHSSGFSLTTLLSPAALRIELLGAVTLVLVAGRLLPGVATVLRQFSQFFFP
jgi:hypothetical protein